MRVARPNLRSVLVLLAAAGAVACSPGASEGPTDRAPGLSVGRLLGSGSDVAGYARAEEARRFRFPADHGAHPHYRSEWWYLTMVLDAEEPTVGDPDRREFGLQFTVFRQALRAEPVSQGPWALNQAYMGHFAITDPGTGVHQEAQRVVRPHPRLARVRAAPLEVFVDGWRLAASDDQSRWRLSARDDDMAVDVQIEANVEPVLQGDRGLSVKGPGQASYYYSMPRMQVSGSLTPPAGAPVRVTGLGWLDREWSTSTLSADHQGWDWFSLMLDDGEDVMVFRLRRTDGARDPHDHGVRVDPDGTAVILDSRAFELTPVRWWRDDEGVRWPVGWRLQIGARTLTIAAALDDQRMDLSVVYWEGLVHVMDAEGEQIGRGYMELTGYAREAADGPDRNGQVREQERRT